MSPVAIATILLLILLFLRVPVFISLLAAVMSYFLLNPELPTMIAGQRILAGAESIPLLAIPFFVCSGVFMNYSGVSRRIMTFASVTTGRMHGGLAQTNILLSALMGGLSGSNLADAAMEAKMLVPEMERKGYSKEFSSVITATSAMITPLIPPGIAMIIYGSIANVSVGQLFIAGLGAGLLLTVILMIFTAFIARRRGYHRERESGLALSEFWSATKPAILPLLLPIIIIGGIRLGIFTPTEAGAIAILYSLALGLAYREMTWDDFVKGIKETVSSTASIMVIITSASAFAWILTKEQVPQQFTELMISVIDNKYLFLLLINLFLLVVGMFIEGNAAMIVLVPLLAPLATSYGIDDIHFAMIFIFNLAVGAISPPMGTLMFVTCSITKCPIGAFIKEAVPYYLVLVVALVLITLFPVFSTGIVNLIY